MTEELRKFMLENSLKGFDALQKNIGKKVVVNFNKTLQDNLPPVQAKINGVLSKVNKFENVVVGGTVVDFVSKRHIIADIALENGPLLYDKSLVVGKNTKVTGDIMKYKTAVMGVTQKYIQKQEFLKSSI